MTWSDSSGTSVGTRRAVRSGVSFWLLIALVAEGPTAIAGTAVVPSELRQPTIEAYNRYIQLTDARQAEELSLGRPFLWIDAYSEARRLQAYEKLRAGEPLIEKLETMDGGHAVRCPGGIIHHWVAAVYIPGATLDQTLALVQNYDRQSIIYAPDVQRSKTIARKDDDFKVFLRFKRKKVITVVLNTEFDIHYARINATGAYSRARSTRIAEVENHDTPQERELPIGDDGGYLWRMDTYWRFLQQGGGTYVQCEAVSLTRDIPIGFKWIVAPFVTSIPRESLASMMEATRRALISPASAAR